MKNPETECACHETMCIYHYLSSRSCTNRLNEALQRPNDIKELYSSLMSVIETVVAVMNATKDKETK